MGAALPWLAQAAALLSSLGHPAWLAHAATLRVVAANSAAETQLGVGPGGLEGRDVFELAVTPEDMAFWTEVAQQPTGADTPATVFEGLHSDSFARNAAGELRPVRRRISRIELGGGDPGFLVQWEDHSEQHRAALAAEAVQAQQQAELHALLENTADGVMVMGVDGRILNFNPRFAALWALPLELHWRQQDDDLLSWMQRRMANPAGYMRRLAHIELADAAPTHDLLKLSSGQVLERSSTPLRCNGEITGRIWSFRETS